MNDSITPPKSSNVVYTDESETAITPEVPTHSEKSNNSGDKYNNLNNTKKTTSTRSSSSSTTTRSTTSGSASSTTSKTTTQSRPRQTTQSVRRNTSRAGCVVVKLASLLTVLVQAGIIALFLLGAVQFYHRDITLIHAVNLIIKVFYINYGTVYRSLIGAAISVVYFIVFAFLVKWIIQSIKKSISTLRNSTELPSDIIPNMNANFNHCTLAFCAVMGFAVVSGLLASGEITIYAFIIMAAVGAMRVIKDILNYCLTGRGDAFGFVLGLIKNIILFFTVCVMIVYLNNQAAKNLIYGLQTMFNGNVFSSAGGVASSLYSLYTNIVEPTIWVAIAITFLIVFVDLLYGSYYGMRSKLVSMIVLTLITVVLHLIFKVFVTSGATSFQVYMLTSWLMAIRKTYIPLLLMQIVLLVMIYLGKKKSVV